MFTFTTARAALAGRPWLHGGLLSLAALSATTTDSVAATQAKKEFCVNSTCFSTLGQAENFLRSEPVPAVGRAFLQKKGEDYSQFPTEIRHNYSVPDRVSEPVEDWWATGVGMSCSEMPGDGPFGPIYCDSLQTIKDLTIARWTAMGYCNVDWTSTVANFEPFVGATFSVNAYGGVPADRLLGVNKTNWPSSYAHLTYQYCPAGTVVNAGPANLSRVLLHRCEPLFKAKRFGSPPEAAPFLCQNFETGVIVEKKVAQYCSTEKGHPCSPATGQKIRHETDFDIDGLRLERHYHSGATFASKAGLGDGWTHNYDSRISGAVGPSTPAENSSVFVIDSRGEFDQFRYAGSSAGEVVYRSANRPAQLLRQRGNPLQWELQLDAQRSNVYDIASGRLLKIRDRSRPAHDQTLSHDAHGRLLAVENAKGRRIEFSYEGWTLTKVTAPDGREYNYSVGADSLEGVEYPDNALRSFGYEQTGLPGYLTSIDDESGVRYGEFAYDADARVISSKLKTGNPVAPDADAITLVYGNGTTTVTTPLGDTETYAFVAGTFERMSGISDSGGSSDISYRSDGRVAERLDRRGTRTVYDYDARHEIRRIEAAGKDSQPQDAFSQERKTETDWDPALDAMTERRVYRCAAPDTTAQACTTAASPRWQLASLQRYAYNSRGQASARCEVDPAVTNALAYACGSAVNAPAGVRQTVTTYCESSDVANGICPLPGLVTAVDGPHIDVADTTSFSYYAADAADCASGSACSYRKGDLHRVTNARGHVTEVLGYDKGGRQSRTLDANGVVTELEYNARGWLTARKLRGNDNTTEADDRISYMEYTPTGLVEKIIQPDGSYATFGYDHAQRLIRVGDNAGNRIDYVLDAAGARKGEETRDAAGSLRRHLSRSYNLLGQLLTQTDAYSNSIGYDYDAEGNATATTDALSRDSSSDFDPLQRLVRELKDIGGVDAETRYRYDERDNLVGVTDPNGLETVYGHNAFGDVTALDSPDTGVTLYSYDEAGNRISKLDANAKSTSYVYDALNRLKVIDYAANVADETFTYDVAMSDCAAGETFAIGRLGRMVDSSGSTAYCYDRFGNLVRKVQRIANKPQPQTLRWQYLPNGRLHKTIYPGNVEVDYQYDSQGRVAEIGANLGGGRSVLLAGASYHPFGPVAQWTYGNSRVLKRSLDQNYRVTRVQDLAGGGIDYLYEYDEAGNLKHLIDGNGLALLRRYDYDGLDRLATETVGMNTTPLHEYGYDKTGNRTSATEWMATGGGTGPGGGGGSIQPVQLSYTYASGSHRLVHDGSDPRSYDAAGNLVKIGSDSSPGGARLNLSYNDANRLSAVSRLAPLASYAYNGIGERVRRTASGMDTYSLYDPSGRWIGDYDQNNAPQQQLIWLGDLPVGLIVGNGDSAKLYYVQADAIGTPRVVIDPVRNVAVWRWNLEGEAFGEDFPNQDPDADGTVFTLDLRFPGQRFDSVTGLNYNYFRDYDASVGRYVQSDPIGLDGGVSTYGYASSAPLTKVDPLGLVTWSGTSYSVGVDAHLGGFIDFYSLSAKCKNGSRASAYVIATGASFSLGAPISMVGTYHIEFEQSGEDPDPDTFNGPYSKVHGPYAAFGLGAASGGYIRMGGAWADLGGGGNRSREGPHRIGGFGLELYGIGVGHAWVKDSQKCKEDCK